jgi:hypothetical protein
MGGLPGNQLGERKVEIARDVIRRLTVILKNERFTGRYPISAQPDEINLAVSITCLGRPAMLLMMQGVASCGDRRFPGPSLN